MEDLTGKRFGRLTVMSFNSKEKTATQYKTYWNCKCDCGNEKVCIGSSLTNGKIQSCGCLHREHLKASKKGHKLSKHKLYNTWRSMKKRCYLKTNASYNDYGGRGIKVCDEWKNSFESFYKWCIDNGYKEGLTLDRIDFNSGYEPSNCRWVDWIVQENNKRNNTKYIFNGEIHGLSEWARIYDMSRDTLWKRLKVYKWGIEKSLTTPVKKRRN